MSSTLSIPVLASPRSPALPRFLMCRPDLYDVTYVINPWMAGNVHHSSQSVAADQWLRLHAQLSKLASIELVEPATGSPDMVFTANAGLESDGIVALSSFAHPERQAEEDHFARWFQNAGYEVHRIPRSTPFEGEGDALFSADGQFLWAGQGPRSVRASHAALAALWDVVVISLTLVDPRFYHLDTCFAPLAGGFVLYYPEAFDTSSQARIEAFYAPEKRIRVNEADALRFACNVINIDRTLILNEIGKDLSDELSAHGFTIIQTPLSEFLKAGGAAKCLVMKLSG